MEFLGFAVIVFAFYFILKQSKHRKVDFQNFSLSMEQQDILKIEVPLSQFLPSELKKLFHQKVAHFLKEVDILGFEGVEVNEKVRLNIAGHACILLLGRPFKKFNKLHSVHVFPDSFFQESNSTAGTSIHHVSGISFEDGKVVLAWSHTQSGSKNLFDGKNVAIHEFAHQFDQEDGSADGVPYDLSPQLTRVWAGVMKPGFDKLRKKSVKKSRTLIDRYGATNPAEFFAVLSETFFEKGKHLKRKEPELYQVMKDYYGLDTASWKKRN